MSLYTVFFLICSVSSTRLFFMKKTSYKLALPPSYSYCSSGEPKLEPRAIRLAVKYLFKSIVLEFSQKKWCLSIYLPVNVEVGKIRMWRRFQGEPQEEEQEQRQQEKATPNNKSPIPYPTPFATCFSKERIFLTLNCTDFCKIVCYEQDDTTYDTKKNWFVWWRWTRLLKAGHITLLTDVAQNKRSGQTSRKLEYFILYRYIKVFDIVIF